MKTWFLLWFYFSSSNFVFFFSLFCQNNKHRTWSLNLVICSKSFLFVNWFREQIVHDFVDVAAEVKVFLIQLLRRTAPDKSNFFNVPLFGIFNLTLIARHTNWFSNCLIFFLLSFLSWSISHVCSWLLNFRFSFRDLRVMLLFTLLLTIRYQELFL